MDASAAVYLASTDSLPSALGSYDCIAPPLMWSEGLSVLVEAAYRGAIPASELEQALGRLEELPISAAGGDRQHRRQSLDVARALGWAKAYDAEYVALARANACPLLTVDRRLIRGASGIVRMLEPTTL